MAAISYDKYKISLNLDSAKNQGLRTGDIVRRQFFTGSKVVYSLMCVLDYGVDEVFVDVENADGSKTKAKKTQPWFIGALLDGDAPKSGELLDFARVTSLFDTNRSGALYLTASDEYSPFMDIIDGIGRNCSLCWPEGKEVPGAPDSKSQYCVKGVGVSVAYQPSQAEYNRLCKITRLAVSTGFAGLKQEFYEYLDNTQRLVVSYRIKGPSKTFKASVGYQSRSDSDEIAGNRTDGIVDVEVTGDWQYKVHVISIENSGRHLRDFRLNLSNLSVGEEVVIADFNIIRLSSLVNFGDASKTRIGRLDGVVDPVYGRLSGYGAYLQKLFASKSVCISGTLTAGDENGFAATFYAGKIHKNAFINSLDISFKTAVTKDSTLINPTGIGSVYTSTGAVSMRAQTSQWCSDKIGKRYCFSCWVYTKTECQIAFKQNETIVGTASLLSSETHQWRRIHCVFDLSEPSNNDDVWLSLCPSFTLNPDDQGAEERFYITAPQLESGDSVTQYQATDDTLSYTEDYGAWFNRGGIGGTIQNPLLRLNYDGKGGIASRINGSGDRPSFALNQDGSGHIAKGNILWKESGDVEFGENVKLSWTNFSPETQDRVTTKSIKIIGPDSFSLLGDKATENQCYSPESIELTIYETNIDNPEYRKWYYQDGDGGYQLLCEGVSAIITPDGPYWENDERPLAIKCVVKHNQIEYADTITIKKQFVGGYTVEVTSVQGVSFKNGVCETTLIANVYYQGKLVAPEYVKQNFVFTWKKYHLPDLDHEAQGWWTEKKDGNGNVVQQEIDRTQSQITVNYDISGRDLYICELSTLYGFIYNWPIIFA